MKWKSITSKCFHQRTKSAKIVNRFPALVSDFVPGHQIGYI